MTKHIFVVVLMLSVGFTVYAEETVSCVNATENVEVERKTVAKQAVDNIKGAVTTWMLSKKKSTPPSDLNVLVKADTGEKPVLGGGESTLIDPWNTAFKIELKGKRFVVISAGPDTVFGTEDDIRSSIFLARSSSTRSENKTIVNQPAKRERFDPFPSTNKIEYAKAVELAKEGNASAYYWLSYYFAKGEGVSENREAACRFLIKAENTGYPQASYLLGCFYERYALSFFDRPFRRSRIPGANSIRWDRASEVKRIQEEKEMSSVLSFFDGDYVFLFSSEDRTPSALKGNCCLTNTVATEYVISLYEKAAHGGLLCATNDIARLKGKIAECSERIQKNLIELKKRQAEQNERNESARMALSILEEEDTVKKVRETEARRRAEEEAKARETEEIAKINKTEEAKQVREAEELEKKQAELAARQREENELWSSWPKKLNGADTLKIAEQAEKKFNCTFYGDFSYGALSDWGVSFTNSWKRGCSVSLIAEKQIWSGRAVEKFDSEGRLVWVCSMDGLTEDAEELNWISAERKAVLEASQLKWATEHGMTLDEAKAKYAKWKEDHPVGRPLGGLRRPGMFGGGLLRARRLQRQQESGSQAK